MWRLNCISYVQPIKCQCNNCSMGSCTSSLVRVLWYNSIFGWLVGGASPLVYNKLSILCPVVHAPSCVQWRCNMAFHLFQNRTNCTALNCFRLAICVWRRRQIFPLYGIPISNRVGAIPGLVYSPGVGFLEVYLIGQNELHEYDVTVIVIK